VSAPDSFILALNFFNSNIPGGHFDSAVPVVIDTAGNVWVANRDSVTKLTSNGRLAGNFNNANTPGANFFYPQAMAIDTSGNVWLTNGLLPDVIASVIKLTSSGHLVGNFAPDGANFRSLQDLAIGSTGNVWVTDASGGSVAELTSSGHLAGFFDNSNTPGANFDAPWSVAIDAAGNVWVANRLGFPGPSGSVTELTFGGDLAGNFSNLNTIGANFVFPSSVAIDTAGKVWVTNDSLDPFGSSVTKLTSIGALVGNFNYSNTPGANFDRPFGLNIDGAGNAWITNISSLTELTSSGALVANFNNTTISSGDDFLSSAIDAAGNVWVTIQGKVDQGVSEVIGAARPVRTPLVACLKQWPPHAVCLP